MPRPGKSSRARAAACRLSCRAPIPSNASFLGLAVRTGMQGKFHIARGCVNPLACRLGLPHLQVGESLAAHDALLAQALNVGGQQLRIYYRAARSEERRVGKEG